VQSLRSRTPQQIVLGARFYTAYINNQIAGNVGGQAEVFSRIVQNIATLNQPGTAAASQFLAAGALAASIAGAVTSIAAGVAGATATAIPAVGAIIGGAIVAVTAIGTALLSPDTSSLKRDDLGRFKPVFERGWLSGNPGDASITGAPSLDVPDPPGFRRIIIGPIIPPVTPGSTGTPSGAQTAAPGASPVVVVGGLVLVGGIAYYLWRGARKAR
jgi:hypothetical protein